MRRELEWRKNSESSFIDTEVYKANQYDIKKAIE